MKRRDVLRLSVGYTLALPSFAFAERSEPPVVGFIRSTGRRQFESIVAAFETGLRDAGYVDDENVRIEYRWAENDLDRLPSLARDLLERDADVIVGNSLAVDAVRTLTNTVPIIFVVADDPVKAGYVDNLNRPGGNLTGVTFFGGSQLNAKRLELLHELVPGRSIIAVLNDPSYPDGEIGLTDATAAGVALGRPVEVIDVYAAAGLEDAFARVAALTPGALLVNGSPFFTSNRSELVELATQTGILAIYDQRSFVEAGGLISYGASFADAYRQAGGYAARILKGDQPGELPVLRPTVLELLVNATAAARLGLTLPSSILLRADDVID
jgi:putative ABC transport system substrate-binding protein